jgi:hypothetical protein
VSATLKAGQQIYMLVLEGVCDVIVTANKTICIHTVVNHYQQQLVEYLIIVFDPTGPGNITCWPAKPFVLPGDVAVLLIVNLAA